MTTGRIWIDPIGNMGNRALQFLSACGIGIHAPRVPIENIHLPEWTMALPRQRPPVERCVLTSTAFEFDLLGLADCLNRNVVDTVVVDSYPYHLGNYPPRAFCRRLIGTAAGGEDAVGYGPDELVCSVRGAEILKNAHPHYIVLPPAYYAMLAARSGLRLVFHGQIGDDVYSRSLRAAFPEARFAPSISPGHDFETLRRSRHVAPSVSTFAWLAAWLSEAESVYLPVAGIFNPMQAQRQLFLPLDEPSYRFTLLPYAQAVDIGTAPAAFALQQEVLAAGARPVTAEELRAIVRRAASYAPGMIVLEGFDPEFYVANNPDVAARLKTGLQSALHHYLHAGYQEGRLPFRFDQAFYVAAYPQAAIQLAEGRYRSPLEHYQRVGRRLNYRPAP